MPKLHKFKDIVAHRCDDDGRGVEVQIKWDTGEVTWEPFATIQKDAPEALAEYGQTREELLGQAPWDSLNIDSVTGENDSVTGENDSVTGENDSVAGENDSVAGENDSVTGENMYTFKRIVDHRRKRRCLSHWEKSIDILIEWGTGETTWEPFDNIANDASSELAEYALEKKLLEHKQWRNLAVHLPEYTTSRYELKKIRNHRPRKRVPRDNGIELEIEWSNGEITWEPADMINKDAPQMFEKYAKRKNILTDFKQQQHNPIILSALEEGSGHTFLVAQRIEFICNYFVEVMKGHELKLPDRGIYAKVWIGYDAKVWIEHDSDNKSDVWLPGIKIRCIDTFCEQVEEANGEKGVETFRAGLEELNEHASEPSDMKGFEKLLIFYGKKQYLSNLWTGEGTKYWEDQFELWPNRDYKFYPSIEWRTLSCVNSDIRSMIKKKDNGNPMFVGYERWDQIGEKLF